MAQGAAGAQGNQGNQGAVATINNAAENRVTTKRDNYRA